MILRLAIGAAFCVLALGAGALEAQQSPSQQPVSGAASGKAPNGAAAPTALTPGLETQKIVTQAEGLAEAQGAMLRGLDKIVGTPTDLPVNKGQTVSFGQIDVTLRECRYPADDPASNAYAYVTIKDKTSAKVIFDGWMIAASPALSALDHPRYDVWVIRCKTN